jgi:hypothetical protein|nr:MAG TPA: hypothetical protein [Caudoviricetes sp.]
MAKKVASIKSLLRSVQHFAAGRQVALIADIHRVEGEFVDVYNHVSKDSNDRALLKLGVNEVRLFAFDWRQGQTVTIYHLVDGKWMLSGSVYDPCFDLN